MDTLRLFDGIVLIVLVVLVIRLATHIDSWRSSVSALHLRWEREQRQAGPAGVTLAQRQNVQARFELLVANRPYRMFWIHLAVGLVLVGSALLLAWDAGDLRWIGLWLALPLGLLAAAILGYAWLLVSQANDKLAATSASLYGPPPPRVKVRTIQTVESEPAEE